MQPQLDSSLQSPNRGRIALARPPNQGATMKRALLFFPLLCVFVSVSLLAQASVTLSPSSYNFGSTPVGTGTAWATFTLSNTGSTHPLVAEPAEAAAAVVQPRPARQPD